MSKTYCYLRVSSPQNGKGECRQSTGSQRTALQQWARAAGVKPVWRQDYMTGRRDDRPGLQGLLKSLQAGDTLAVWKLDRLGRSCVGTIRTLQALIERKVKVVVTSSGLTFSGSDAMGMFLLQLFSALAELESSTTSERIRAGLAHARASGKRLGRPRDERHRARLLRWRAAGLSIGDIAKRAGRSPKAVGMALSRMKKGGS